MQVSADFLLEALSFRVGALHVGPTVTGTWLVMGLLAGAAWLGTRGLRVRNASRLQLGLEAVVLALRDAIESAAPGHGLRLLPFIGTLWLFIGSANLLGLVPGLASPTSDLSLTLALAVMVFAAVPVYGVRTEGWRAYLRHYVDPNPILLPFHVLGEFTRTLALAIRLFGNVMSLEMAALMVLVVAGFLAPVPLLVLHIIEAVVQAYIFGTLALVYVAGDLQARSARIDRMHRHRQAAAPAPSSDDLGGVRGSIRGPEPTHPPNRPPSNGVKR